jgi:hypothetical protein
MYTLDTYVQYTDNGLPIEETRENIYDKPHISKECSSPPPTGPEYYNQSAILTDTSQ